jgi:VanZ family protein
MRWIAGSYVVLLLVIVALADTGELGWVVRFVHDVPVLDKVGHLVFALGLGAMLEGATRSRGRTLWIAVPIVLAEELSQLFVPGRTFDLLDLAADGLGLAIGTIVVIRLRARSSVSAPTSTRAAATGCMRA